MGGMNIHKYQSTKYVLLCVQKWGLPFYPLCQHGFSHHFPYQMACVQLDFLKDPAKKKTLIYYPLDAPSNICPIQIIEIIDSASLVLGYTPFPDTSILPRPGPLGKLRTAA